jgi:transcriptional regulator with XRE-family HTH domain
MDPATARAARALLGLTQTELARRAGIGLSTLQTYEGAVRATGAANIARIKAALEDVGAVFRPDGSIISAEQILDQFTQLKNPTSAQRGEAILAAAAVARNGGRLPPMNSGARSIVRAYEKSLGIREDDDQ